MKKMTTRNLAKYVALVGLTSTEKEAKEIIDVVFEKINDLVINEDKEVYIHSFGTFCQRSNTNDNRRSLFGGDDKKIIKRTTTLAFRRALSGKTKRIDKLGD